MKLLLVFFALVLTGSRAALPVFSWETLPVFFHSSNASGMYTEEALQVIARYPMVTIEKWQSYDIKTIDDEDAMAVFMKAVKGINPNVATYFYMNSFKVRPEMTRMARQFMQNPEYQLKDDKGNLVKNSQGFYAFDLSKVEVRKWWMNTCLNATQFSNGDGCFCDSSQRTDGTFTPPLSHEKAKAWGEGLLSLTKEVQQALGEDKLLIGKTTDQPYVKCAQIENFSANNGSINELMLGVENKKFVQAHVPVREHCTNDLTDYMAAFLIGAGENSYFGCGDWHGTGNDSIPFMWHPEYDRTLGEPTAQAKYKDGMWSREFASGTEVWFDTHKNKGTIIWKD